MINGLSFTGRETMLTKGIKRGQQEAADIAKEYLAPDKIYSKAERFAAEQQKRLNYAAAARSEGAAAKSYAVSHGIPEDVADDNIQYCLSLYM